MSTRFRKMLKRGLMTAMVCAMATTTVGASDGFLLGAPFADGAVLQRDMTVPVWGWSAPGDTLTVEFAGQKKSATADADGKWVVELDPMAASFEPRTMTVTSSIGNRQSAVGNILVGEVWMASGQSNMQWKAGKSNCSKLEVVPKNGVNPIREFEVTSVFAQLHPIEKATGAWKDGNYGDHSAIAFAFAHKLYEELGVPIGILNCSFSQTSIQAWVPRVGFRDGKDEYTQAIYRRVLETDPASDEHKTAWRRFYADIKAALKADAARVARGEAPEGIPTRTPGNMHGNRDATWLFNGRLSPVVPYAIRGAIWNQGYANMGEGLPYYNNLHSLIRGWRLVWDRPDLPVYFHQFYSAGNAHSDARPSIGSTAEMRLGTWLARDIPNTGMASQIDIEGAIHYRHKAVPGQRLALHALKNQYGKAVAADGPMFKSYAVEGNKLIVEFDHADGGLVVGDAGINALGEHGSGFAEPAIIANGESQVKLFYLADGDRVWHPASLMIDGDKVVLTAPAVKQPRGVSYGTGGVGFQPSLYNKALLPMTPFIAFDNEMVTSKNWPDEKLKVAGEVIDPDSVGKLYAFRKLPLLSTQFRDNAVLQAGKPVTVWGAAIPQYGQEVGGEAVVHFRFDGIEKTIPVTPGMTEWQVTLPPMVASAQPRTLTVTYTIDGELAHTRVATNIVFGDVWYVAAPSMNYTVPTVEPSGQIVRMMARQAKRDANGSPSRYSVSVSTAPGNRFASYWKEAEGLAAALGNQIAARSGKPVGIIFMQTAVDGKGREAVDKTALKHWIAPADLKLAPSLMADYRDLAAVRPGNEFYEANVKRYIDAWKSYWGEYIPAMIATKAVPDGRSWGSYPSLAGEVSSKAGQVYNVMVDSFTPASLKGVVFLSSPAMVEAAGPAFGEQLAVLANSWKVRFGGDPLFVYTLPDGVAKPAAIQGESLAVMISDWKESGEKLLQQLGK